MDAKIGFIGFGNIAGAIARGACSSDYITPKQIYIYDCLEEKNDLATKYGYQPLKSESEVCAVSDFIFLTVKPQTYGKVLQTIQSEVTPEKCLVSVAAGKSIDYVKKQIGFDCKVIRVMPNTPLLLGYGACGIAVEPPVEKEELEDLVRIFESCAVTEIVDERLMDAVTAVSGSSPAYIFAFARAIIQQGTKEGLAEQAVTHLLTATLIGSAQMIQNTDLSLDALIQMVASPKGTTEAALKKLNEGNFEPLIQSAMNACIDRAKELSKLE